MRTITTIAVTSVLVLWGAYFLLKDKDSKITKSSAPEALEKSLKDNGSLLSSKRLQDLDKIGSVINEGNVDLDESTKAEIKAAKNFYDNKESIKELQAMLEQSYMDPNSTIKDLKRLQGTIVAKKNKIKAEVVNTERWDPRFVYYLMLQENYTYAEINHIKSLAENGLNMEEMEYINELIREDAFMEKINAYKSQSSMARTVASVNKKKEGDEFLDDGRSGGALEDKLIEMNYNQEEKEDTYGNN